MKQTFTASIWREGDWFVAQCLEVDVARQGETEEEAAANLKEALELHFEPPRAAAYPEIRSIEVEIRVVACLADEALAEHWTSTLAL